MIGFLKLLDLLLCRGQRLAKNKDLLVRNPELLLRGLSLPRCRGFSSDIIEVVFPISPKLGMFEFPRLYTPLVSPEPVSTPRKASITDAPYGDCPFSSLCRTLWKSYLLSCRTKLAKLLCLKCFGSIVLVNFSFYKLDVNINNKRHELETAYLPRERQSCRLRCPT